MLVIVYPVSRALSLSFLHFKLNEPNDIRFIGFQNYLKGLKDPLFWISLKNSFVYVFFSVGLQFILGLALSLILVKGKLIHRVIRTLILIPWVTPGVLGAFMWRWMFNGNYGILNHFLTKLHIIDQNVPWLSDPNLALPCVILVTVWRGMPFFTVTLIAGLQSISPELHEASQMDGVTRWQELTKITIPIIMPIVVTTTLLRIIWTANYVDLIYLLTEGGPGYSSLVLPLFTYSSARIGLDYGYSSALAILLSIVLIGVVIVYFRQVKKQELI